MSQKSNLLTLRVKQSFLNLYSTQDRFFYLWFVALNHFFRLLRKLHVFVTSSVVNVLQNKIFMSLNIFFRKALFLRLFRKKVIKRPKSRLKFAYRIFLKRKSKRFFKYKKRRHSFADKYKKGLKSQLSGKKFDLNKITQAFVPFKNIKVSSFRKIHTESLALAQSLKKNTQFVSLKSQYNKNVSKSVSNTGFFNLSGGSKVVLNKKKKKKKKSAGFTSKIKLTRHQNLLKRWKILLKAKQKLFSLFFKKNFYNKFNCLSLNIKNMNMYFQKYVSFEYLKVIRLHFKQDGKVLFPRRHNFFLDMIKLTTLFAAGAINTLFYIRMFSDIFKILQKQRHAKFLYFIKRTLLLLCSVNVIVGIKCRISGKLKGKTRAKSKYMIVGAVPNQSFDKNIEYAQSHAFTKYGVFGFKLWVYKKK